MLNCRFPSTNKFVSGLLAFISAGQVGTTALQYMLNDELHTQVLKTFNGPLLTFKII